MGGCDFNYVRNPYNCPRDGQQQLEGKGMLFVEKLQSTERYWNESEEKLASLRNEVNRTVVARVSNVCIYQ